MLQNDERANLGTPRAIRFLFLYVIINLSPLTTPSSFSSNTIMLKRLLDCCFKLRFCREMNYCVQLMLPAIKFVRVY
jgi:hypothetical protein